MIRPAAATVALIAAMTGPASAESRAVTLAAMSFSPSVELTVSGPDGQRIFRVDELEALGTRRIETRTPWRDEAAVFDGVLLSDILASVGLDRADAVRITAENAYSVVVPRAVWTDYEGLVATRVDGRPHSRRARGPLQLVFHMDDLPHTAGASFERNWVWMAARIEPVQ